MDIDTGQLPGQPILGVNGERIGSVGSVYLDNQTGRSVMGRGQDRVVRQQVGAGPAGDAQPDLAGGFRLPYDKAKVRVEREPITETNRGAAYRGPELSEAEHEVVLRAERPVMAKQTVPVERVRLDTQAVTERAQVTETLRKEEIDTDGVEDIPAGSADRRARD